MALPQSQQHCGWRTQRARSATESSNPVPSQNTVWTQHAHTSISPYPADFVQVPIIAELPAPLPPAPPTTTPSRQLEEDEKLARKLSRIELVEDARRRSSSAVSQSGRPLSLNVTNMSQGTPLTPQISMQSLRPFSQSVNSNVQPWSPGSFGPPPNELKACSLPEVDMRVEQMPIHKIVSGPQVDDLPIPVLADQQVLSRHVSFQDLSSMSNYLEQHRQVPYPAQWRLPPVFFTLFAYQGSKISSRSTWLDTPDSCSWRAVRPVEHAHNPAQASFTFKFHEIGGNFRSPKFTWLMTCPQKSSDASKKLSRAQKAAWSYELKLDSKTGMRKTEVLNHGQQKAILTTYVHASNYDSLRFVGPDGHAYTWVSSAKVSSVNGARYDTSRHALFVAAGRIQDPLYGEIVADHTFWDGFVNENEVHLGTSCGGCKSSNVVGRRWRCKTCQHQDICNNCHVLALGGHLNGSIEASCTFSLVNLPDEALNIRSQVVDPALVVATLQILKDWEKRTLRDERKKNLQGFRVSEEAARSLDLGIMAYWKAEDWTKRKGTSSVHGTQVKAKSIVAAFTKTANELGNLGEASFALAGICGSNMSGGDTGSSAGMSVGDSGAGGGVS